MKNTRKKMLLSSIAMLLVALVALGSATFAWYADVTTVTAQTSTWNATTSSGLVIRHENDSYTGSDKTAQTAWTTALNTANGNALKTASNLSPRALEFSKGYAEAGGASAKADDRTSSHATTLTKIATANADSGYLVDHMFVAGEGSSEEVKMSVTAGAAANATSYLNLAVYVNGNLKKVFTSSTATSTKSLTINGDTATEGSAYTIVPFTGSAQYVDNNKFEVASKASGGTEIQIIAYVDGFNEQCKSDSVDVSSISVTYSFEKQ